MNGFLNKLVELQNIPLQEVVQDLPKVLDSMPVIFYISILVLGLLFCFLGLKLLKLWSVIECFWLGVVLGYIPSLFLNLQPMVIFIIMIVIGIVFAITGILISRMGMFVVSLFAGLSFAGFLAMMLGVVGFLIGAVFALVMAVLAAIIKRPIVIMMTSLQGAVLCTRALNDLIGHEQLLISLAIFVVLAIVGIIVQLMMRSKEVHNKEMKKAEELRADYSKEVDIEMARTILDDDDEEIEE